MKEYIKTKRNKFIYWSLNDSSILNPSNLDFVYNQMP
jgi:hypothetical protein